MNRYLLINAGCGTCSTIGEQVQEQAGDGLVVRSLAELEIQQYLNTALPQGWEWEPMVLEVSDGGKDIKVYSGVYMRLRLIQVLGIFKACRVASVVYKSVNPVIPAPERRTFLRYSGGLMAGMAVLGLKPLRTAAHTVFETPNGNISSRQLTGDELTAAVEEATTSTHYGRFLSSMTGREYSENRSEASAILIEMDGSDPVLAVTIPYSSSDANRPAQAKYLRYGSTIDLAVGIANTQDSTSPSIRVFEVESDQVRHTLTMKIQDGQLVREPVGQSATSIERVDLPSIDDFSPHLTKCQVCMGICRAIHWAQCGSVSLVACWLICLTLPPACVWMCPILVGAICNGAFGGKKCKAVCKHFKYCP